jgi:hypothetical protein
MKFSRASVAALPFQGFIKRDELIAFSSISTPPLRAAFLWGIHHDKYVDPTHRAGGSAGV